MFSRLIDILTLKMFRKSENIRDTIEELIEDNTGQNGSPLEIEEKNLLANVIRLHDQTADDIAIARPEIAAVSTEMPFHTIVSMFLETEYARMPLYEGQLDNIIGYIHARDILKNVDSTETMDLRKFVRDILFIAPSMRLLDLMIQMRETKIPMAIVVDEYGDVGGLITIWDVIREVIGDVSIDYGDEEKSQITKLSDGSFILSARMALEDFETICGSILTEQERNEEDLDTVGGLVTFLAGHMPARREVIHHSSGIFFEILEADPRRVIRVRVHPVKQTETNADEKNETL